MKLNLNPQGKYFEHVEKKVLKFITVFPANFLGLHGFLFFNNFL